MLNSYAWRRLVVCFVLKKMGPSPGLIVIELYLRPVFFIARFPTMFEDTADLCSYATRPAPTRLAQYTAEHIVKYPTVTAHFLMERPDHYKSFFRRELGFLAALTKHPELANNNEYRWKLQRVDIGYVGELQTKKPEEVLPFLQEEMMNRLTVVAECIQRLDIDQTYELDLNEVYGET